VTFDRAVYLDYSATTPVDPRIAQRMSRCLLVEGTFGNPASRSHVYGWEAEELVENARTQVAALFNADPREIVWTSGATESDNLAIKGVIEAVGGQHIVTTSYEHKAVLDTCAYLESFGIEVTYVDPNSEGIVHPDEIADAIREDTALVSVMHANNEIGVVNDIGSIGAICRDRGVPFHTDAAQSAGKVSIDVRRDNVDLMSVSGHKIYAPKGIGALLVRREPPIGLVPQIHGGGHERGMRSGTLATHQIVGLGEACDICRKEMEGENERVRALRDRLWARLKQEQGTSLNGSEDHRLPGNLNVSFADVDGETLLTALDDVAVSSGSACTSATVEPSYVLKAIGVPDALAHSSLRFTVGRYTTESDVDFASRRVSEVVEKLRASRV
jgi:cysteine desulfurase